MSKGSVNRAHVYVLVPGEMEPFKRLPCARSSASATAPTRADGRDGSKPR